MSNFADILNDRFSIVAATKDDEYVAQVISTTKTMDSVHNLEDEAILDDFMGYLSETGVLHSFSTFQASQYQRVMIPFYYFLITYLAKTLLGIKAMKSLPALLFSDQGVMRTLGFSAMVLEEGYCNRGAGKRHNDTPPASPFTPQTLAEFMNKATPQEIEQLFNTNIANLAASGAFYQQVTGIIDGTDIETTPNYEGAGKVTRKKKIHNKKGVREIECVVYGWKAIVLFDQHTEIPLALKVVPIHEHESKYTRVLIEQAQRNLGKHSRITQVLMDRGFLDGTTLYWLDQQKITFVIPARSNMDVAQDARDLAQASMGVTDTRQEKQTSGRGKSKTEHILETQVTGVKELTSYVDYRDPAQPAKQYSKTSGGGWPINAVVIQRYRNEEIPTDKCPVFLTNAPVDRPFVPYDAYDGRSLIENLLFREGKQGWNLEHAPTKTANGMVSHVYFTFLTIALTTAYRTWCAEQTEEDEEGEPSNQPSEGIRNWRRRLMQENQDQIIVFCGPYYGIFHLMTFVQLLGGRVKDQSPRRTAVFRQNHHFSP
ncbi:MAG: transposase [Novibacillus thermophilus]